MERKKLSDEEINYAITELKGWKIANGNLYKRFSFPNFAESLAFVNRVGAIAERRDHHPDICFGWGYAEFSVTTHDIGGLTQNDFDLAKEINEIQ
ncbi:MAG: 4a-hydroxytetrahydrobiopterin dehydratase [Pyrinomonadaceae bacterium]